MERLLDKSRRKIKSVPIEFKRYLYHNINLNYRLVSILGARGAGKTTLLLQLGKRLSGKMVLYVALDDLFFTDNTPYSLAEQFHKAGGEVLLLDEVHKYPTWSREIKLIFDDFADLQVIFTSSSVLDIYRGESDLSRRVSHYRLPEMSFREYLIFQHGINMEPISLDDILNHHHDITYEMLGTFKPLKYFPDYLKHGTYPYFSGDEMDYHQKLLNTVNQVLDVDLPVVHRVDYENIAKFKRLLYVLATNVPFTPNISKLSEKINLHRNALVHALQWFSKAELLHILYKQTRSISVLSKPDKIWLHNTNLSYALGNRLPDKGNLRETFFISQLKPAHDISLPDKGDFWIDDRYLIEIGGKNKTGIQIQGQPNAYIVKDDMETGVLKSIPLWLFGFLY
ncbi:MAG: ATP-binding protein [Bacteroidales bacterium]|nr:ATP-binding protein [Bacteroidales bacterium]